MQLMVIVARRPMDRYVYIPELDTGGAVSEWHDDVQAYAIALAAAATGLPSSDLQVSLLHAMPGEVLLAAPPTEVEVRHEGSWRAAQHTGWSRQWSGSWWPVVAYAADGAMWTRTVRASRVRRLHVEVPTVPDPRAGLGTELVSARAG